MERLEATFPAFVIHRRRELIRLTVSGLLSWIAFSSAITLIVMARVRLILCVPPLRSRTLRGGRGGTTMQQETHFMFCIRSKPEVSKMIGGRLTNIVRCVKMFSAL